MREKEYQVMKYLGEQTGWCTASLLAKAVGSSVRSVKTYIGNLREQYPGLIESSRSGFRICDREKLVELLKETDQRIPQNAESRKAYILKSLLIDNQTRDLDELAAELCISPVTLANELAAVKSELIPFELVFRTKQNMAYIDEPEKNKKKMISHLILEESRDFFTSLDILQNYIPHYDLKAVRRIVTEALTVQHLFMDDFSLLNFILHIGITMERSYGRKTTAPALADQATTETLRIPGHILTLLAQITGTLGARYDIFFTADEIHDLALLLMTRIAHEEGSAPASSYLNDAVGEEISALVNKIHQSIMETFNLDINNQDFLMRFALHLRNLVVRLENDITLRNPQMLNIKNTYPYIYEVSVFIADIISRAYNQKLSEDEIAYIALHIGVLIEEQKALKDKVKVLLLCPSYYSSDTRLAARIRDTFQDSLLLTHIITSPDELTGCSDYDCILSTIVLPGYPGVPILHISDYFRSEDVGHIADLLHSIKRKKLQARLEHKLKFLFKDGLFFYNNDSLDRDTVIDQMALALQNQDYVGTTYREQIYEREAISSSAYANIAMPHPLGMSARATAIAVYIAPSGISWTGATVNLVFMLAIHADDRLLFRDIFDFVTEIISDEKYMLAILNTKTYDDFIDLLVSFI